MDGNSLKLIEKIIPNTYAKIATEALAAREKLIRILLEHRKMPEVGWDDATVELFLNRLSMMDSNNYLNNAGLGEREARIASGLVAKRHFNFGHGIGRSGDLTEPQPKAAGSSLMYKLTHCMLQDFFKMMGIDNLEVLLVPMATGMSLMLCMLTLRRLRQNAKYVLWSRIDQKACFKSILTAGLEPIVIDTVPNGHYLETDVKAIEAKISELGAENIVCVMTTTSCFAPRLCDKIDLVAKVCKTHNIPHLINNAYGLQSKYFTKHIQRAARVGRVDLFVQSTDKNLLVPVGGAVICGFDKQLLQQISQMYAGRASSSPIIDVFITLLNIGKSGYIKLMEQREMCYVLLATKLKELATKIDEEVVATEDNPISIGLTLSKVPEKQQTEIGSKLFLRNVSGARVVTTTDSKVISGFRFDAWGTHSSTTKVPYLTAAAGLGVNQEEILVFMKKLEKLLVSKSITDEV